MEQIFIDKLQVYGHHGVYEHEKKQGQIFIVDCICDVSFQEATSTDSLANTTDYGNLCLFIKKYFEEKSYDLIETAADELATEIILSFPGIQGIELSICKPDAPIPMEFKGVGVRVTKKWTQVAISFGSNMGDREGYITSALELLMGNSAIRNVCVSDYIETEPYGYVNQDKFLNGAAIFDTILSPNQLLNEFHSIEAKLDRVRDIHWGPRTIDLDILLYDDLQINEKNLIIPHIDMCNRSFVLEPLAQIAPGMVHPVRRRTIYDLYQMLQKQEKMRDVFQGEVL